MVITIILGISIVVVTVLQNTIEQTKAALCKAQTLLDLNFSRLVLKCCIYILLLPHSALSCNFSLAENLASLSL